MRNRKYPWRLLGSALGLFAVLSMVLGAWYLHASTSKAASPAFVRLSNSAAEWIKSKNVHQTRHHPGSDQMTVAVMLRTSNSAEQSSLLQSLYHPKSLSYRHWLATGQFSTMFAPRAADIAAVSSFLTSAGMKIVASPDPMMVIATGTMRQIETTFHTQIDDYSVNAGTYYANSKEVEIPSSLSASVLAVVGMSDIAVEAPHYITNRNTSPKAPPPPYGGGPFGSGLTPSQIRGIYDVNPVYTALKDQGQGTTIAVYELAGYNPSDIRKYEKQYHLPNVPLVNIPVLGGPTSHNGAAEVELDIELQIAMAPHVKQLLVYEAPNTELGALTEYLQITKDNRADAISTSWGIPCELFVNSQVTLAENQIFMQMAAQGQSIFAASGDAGAYGCARVGVLPPPGEELQIGDPNNQPYITAVGATSFQGPDNVTTFDPGTNPNPTYPGSSKELPWTDGCDPQQCVGGATGGGISRLWAEPDYAANLSTGQYFPGVISQYSQSGSYCGQQPGVLCRENPDVSLDGDPSTGYSIYCTDPGDSLCASGEFGTPGWIRLGGTSTAAPLWAGIAALDITHHGHTRLGLFNYIVYPFDSPAGYASQFHDIISNFTNGATFVNANGQTVSGYPATQGYDLETGVGTPDIYNFINS